MQPGDIIELRGKTLRGKNRIARGGVSWKIVRFIEDSNFIGPAVPGVMVESVQVGQRESFWISLPTDSHMEVINP